MAPPIQESRWVGRVLRDKWRIDGRIARGGMGTVFAATHKNNGITAAIKVLHPEFSRDPDTRSRFVQEGYAANQVNHPGVVRILDDDVTDDGLAYLVMELLDGELLEQRRLRMGGVLPLGDVYEVADQLLDVLTAAHAKGIIHRDIKPENIFMTRDGRLKVLDFGFAQMKSGFRQEQTATGFLLGTPGFMAPEQAMGNRLLIDERTDIWAVGATLFMLLTGAPVHACDSAAEMLVAAANFHARSIATVNPRLPAKVIAAVDRALAYDRGERWPDARSMQAALRKASVPATAHDRERSQRKIPDLAPPSSDDDLGDDRADDDKTELNHHLANFGDDSSESEGYEEKTKAFVRPGDEDDGDEGLTIPAMPSAALRAAQRAKAGTLPPEDATMIMNHGRPPTQPLTPRSPAHPFPPSYSAVRSPMSSYAFDQAPVPHASTGHAAIAPTGVEPNRGAQLLQLFLLGGITMVVVILTGLLVILGSD